MSDSGNDLPLAVGSFLRGQRYRIEAVLGSGGFGITYRAHDAVLQIDVAIKEFMPPGAYRVGDVVRCAPTWTDSFEVAKDDFLREARALARVAHPNVVHLYDHFDERNTAYMVMEYLAGQDYSAILRSRGQFTFQETAGVLQAVAGGLSAIHGSGLVHRDVKPANIIGTFDGRVVLVDFGAARNLSSATAIASKALISNGYSPVEQYSAAALTPASDVYALAAMTYEFLAGAVPTASVDRMVGAPLASPREVDPRIPQFASDAVMSGMALRQQDRPQSANDYLGLFLGSARRTQDRGSAGHRQGSDGFPTSATEPARIAASSGRTMVAAQPLPGGRRRSPAVWGLGAALVFAVLVIGLLLGRRTQGSLASVAIAMTSPAAGADPATTASLGPPTTVEAAQPAATTPSTAPTVAPTRPLVTAPPPPVDQNGGIQAGGAQDGGISDGGISDGGIQEGSASGSGPAVASSDHRSLNGLPCPTTAAMDYSSRAYGSIQVAQYYTAKHHVTVCQGPSGYTYFGAPLWFAYDGSQSPPALTALLDTDQVGSNDFIATKGRTVWRVNGEFLKVTDGSRVSLYEQILSSEFS